MIGVRGTTRLFGIIGDPLAQARSPEMMNAVFAEREMDAVLVPLLIRAGDLEQAVAGLRVIGGFGGAIVTMPHKRAVMPLVTRLGRAAEELGAVNVVRREPDGTLTGDMLDGEGFLAGLRSIGQDVACRRVLLVGAGAAATAIAFAVARAGAGSITVTNRTLTRAEDLAGRIRASGTDAHATDAPRGGFDIVINASSAGVRPSDPMPLDVAVLRPGMIVSDIVVGTRRTPLVDTAEALGCIVQDGDAMLAGQIQQMADFLLGATGH